MNPFWIIWLLPVVGITIAAIAGLRKRRRDQANPTTTPQATRTETTGGKKWKWLKWIKKEAWSTLITAALVAIILSFWFYRSQIAELVKEADFRGEAVVKSVVTVIVVCVLLIIVSHIGGWAAMRKVSISLVFVTLTAWGIGLLWKSESKPTSVPNNQPPISARPGIPTALHQVEEKRFKIPPDHWAGPYTVLTPGRRCYYAGTGKYEVRDESGSPIWEDDPNTKQIFRQYTTEASGRWWVRSKTGKTEELIVRIWPDN